MIVGILIHPNGSLSHSLQGFKYIQTVVGKIFRRKFWLPGFFTLPSFGRVVVHDLWGGPSGGQVDDGLRFQTWKSMLKLFEYMQQHCLFSIYLCFFMYHQKWFGRLQLQVTHIESYGSRILKGQGWFIFVGAAFLESGFSSVGVNQRMANRIFVPKKNIWKRETPHNFLQYGGEKRVWCQHLESTCQVEFHGESPILIPVQEFLEVSNTP